MKASAMQYAGTVALTCALVLAATAGPFAPVRAGAEGGGALAQYCVPQHDNTDLHRIFCREHG